MRSPSPLNRQARRSRRIRLGEPFCAAPDTELQPSPCRRVWLLDPPRSMTRHRGSNSLNSQRPSGTIGLRLAPTKPSKSEPLSDRHAGSRVVPYRIGRTAPSISGPKSTATCCHHRKPRAAARPDGPAAPQAVGVGACWQAHPAAPSASAAKVSGSASVLNESVDL